MRALAQTARRLGPLDALASAGNGIDLTLLGVLLAGFTSQLVPLFWDWSRGAFASGAQGYEPIVVALSIWLAFRRRRELLLLESRGWRVGGVLMFVVGLAAYLLGRSYDLRLALVALVVQGASILLFYKGPAAFRPIWFSLLFPVFAAPLPLDWVLAITGPLKTGVSIAAAGLLALIGFDIGRTGVIVTIGQYQLLVTEACAGLQIMFTLEAMGLLYTNLRNHASVARNVALAILVVPIAFLANVVRVVVLALVTYQFGDAAGRGFLHAFAGMTLFGVALALVIGTDWLLGRIPRMAPRRP